MSYYPETEGLSFEAGPHRYTFKGRAYPSVTQVMRPLTAPVLARAHPADLERARQLGTDVHEAIHAAATNAIFRIPPHTRPYIEAAVAWELGAGFDCMGREFRIMHPSLGYCGTVDLYGWLNGELVLIDYKTAQSLEPYIGVQLAAYQAAMSTRARMLQLEPISRRFALHLTGTGPAVLREYRAADDMPCFAGLLNQYQWSRNHRVDTKGTMYD